MVVTAAVKRCGIAVCALLVLVGLAAPAAAQAPVAVSGGVDVTNKYMFRGIAQNVGGAAVWPALDLAVTPFSGDGGLKSIVLNFGTWNSLHTKDNPGTSSGGWYESDFYAAMTFNGAKGAFTATYTSYMSPNDAFSHVKEVMFKAAVTDSAAVFGIKPYAAVAVELSDASADGGAKKGTYMEIGMAPSIPLPRGIVLNVGTKFGLSLGSYYEHRTGGTNAAPVFTDNRFGYSSSSAILVIPLGQPDTPGAHWNVRGGIEYQGLGTNLKRKNDGDKSQFIGTFGVGFSY